MDSHPLWIQELADLITPHFKPLGVLAPVGCHTYYDQQNDLWEISLFASKTEVLGGEKDGVVVDSNFVVDLKSILQVFNSVDHLEWQALPFDDQDELGAHITIEGHYEQHRVWLRILSKTPEQLEIGQILDAQSQKFFELW